LSIRNPGRATLSTSSVAANLLQAVRLTDYEELHPLQCVVKTTVASTNPVPGRSSFIRAKGAVVDHLRSCSISPSTIWSHGVSTVGFRHGR